MKKIVTVSALLLVTACIGVLIVIQVLRDRSPSTTDIDIDELTTDINVPAPLPSEQLPLVEADSTGTSSSLLFLGNHCPETLGEAVWSDEKCLAALDRHFMDKAAYRILFFGMVPHDGSFTHRTMIENLERDIELVMEALSRQECRLLEGPIRMDLRDTCNADSFFRLTRFAELCDDSRNIQAYFKPRESPFQDENEKALYEDALAQYRNERRQYWEEIGVTVGDDGRQVADSNWELVRNFRKVDQELRAKYGIDRIHPRDDGQSRYQRSLKDLNNELDWKPPDFWGYSGEWNDQAGWYYLWRNGLRENVLREVWMDARGLCPPDLTKHSLPTLVGRPPDEDVLRWWNEKREESRNFQPMLEIAQRLGDERLIVVGSHHFPTTPDTPFSRPNSFAQSKVEMFPWIWQIGLASMNQYVNRPESLKDAARGLVGLRKAGYEADIDGTVEILCEISPERREKLENCASAIRKAELLLDKDSTEELRVLDEIEEAAIRLGVYQY